MDQLTDKLREPRVRRIIEPMLMGAQLLGDGADVQYVLDLSLVKRQPSSKALGPANQIYAQVLPRVLSNVMHYRMNEERILPSW